MNEIDNWFEEKIKKENRILWQAIREYHDFVKNISDISVHQPPSSFISVKEFCKKFYMAHSTTVKYLNEWKPSTDIAVKIKAKIDLREFWYLRPKKFIEFGIKKATNPSVLRNFKKIKDIAIAKGYYEKS